MSIRDLLTIASAMLTTLFYPTAQPAAAAAAAAVVVVAAAATNHPRPILAAGFLHFSPARSPVFLGRYLPKAGCHHPHTLKSFPSAHL